jgi:oxalate---CoA ligase
MGGPLPEDVFQDASSLEESSMEEQAVDGEDWREWPLLASDGDMAALIELVSEDKVSGKYPFVYKPRLIMLG